VNSVSLKSALIGRTSSRGKLKNLYRSNIILWRCKQIPNVCWRKLRNPGGKKRHKKGIEDKKKRRKE
jgi:hypothetical protein